MGNAYIVGAVRTPGGRKNGKLSQWHPADLGALVLDEIVERTGVEPEMIDDVIFGCVSQSGAQSGNIARTAVLASSLPESVPGTTVDRQCGSSQQAIHFAAQAVMSETQDIVIAGGVEVMSQVPIGAAIIDSFNAGHGQPFGGKGTSERYPGVQFSQFTGAEMMAERWKMPREELDSFALASHQKAINATEGGFFDREIVPVEGDLPNGEKEMVTVDEGIRFDASEESLSGLNTLTDKGVLTAGTSSQICDGAAAVMLVNDAGLKKLGLKPRAKVVALALAGDDPVIMLTGPIPASKNVLEKASMSIEDIDLYEVNEAFAPVPLAWAKELNADLEKLNVNGGAIALGHPLGCTGAKLSIQLLNEMKRRNQKYGMVTACVGGGQGIAGIFERL